MTVCKFPQHNCWLWKFTDSLQVNFVDRQKIIQSSLCHITLLMSWKLLGQNELNFNQQMNWFNLWNYFKSEWYVISYRSSHVFSKVMVCTRYLIHIHITRYGHYLSSWIFWNPLICNYDFWTWISKSKYSYLLYH